MVTTRSQDRVSEEQELGELPLRSRPSEVSSSPSLKRPRTPMSSARPVKRSKLYVTQSTEIRTTGQNSMLIRSDDSIPLHEPPTTKDEGHDKTEVTAHTSGLLAAGEDVEAETGQVPDQQRSPALSEQQSQDLLLFEDPAPAITTTILDFPSEIGALPRTLIPESHTSEDFEEPEKEGFVTAPSSVAQIKTTGPTIPAIDLNEANRSQALPTAIDLQTQAQSPIPPHVTQSVPSDEHSQVDRILSEFNTETAPNTEYPILSRAITPTPVEPRRRKTHRPPISRPQPEPLTKGAHFSSSLARYRHAAVERHKRTPFWAGKKMRFVGVGAR